MSLKISNAACSVGEKYQNLLELEKSSFDRILTKTCTLKPIPKPQSPLWRSEKIYSINNYGLGNDGYNIYSSFSFPGKPYVISVTGSYKELRTIANDKNQPDFLEINVSCPNSNKKIIDWEELYCIPFTVPFGIKLSPLFNKKDIHELAGNLNILRGFQKNFRYVVCCNTLPMEGGGVGGKVLKPTSLYNIQHLKKHLRKDINIWGCGGISSITDLKEYEKAGCYGVQIATSIIQYGLDKVDELVKEYKNS